jgi:putative nucleotidyltransferase with HDIG domain
MDLIVITALTLPIVAYFSVRTRRGTAVARAAARARHVSAVRSPARTSEHPATSRPRPAPRSAVHSSPGVADAAGAPRAQTRTSGPAPLGVIFADVVERHKLPPLPTAVSLAMQAMREQYVELERVCRIIATDPALAGRIVSLARSPLYALRRSPQTLMEATAVLGLTTTKRILMTAGMDMLQGARTANAEQLWHHSLATALAAHLLVRRGNTGSPDQAYLAGLLHDVGQVVLLQSHEARFLDCWRTVRDAAAGCEAERAAYGRDHAFIGASILYQWKIDDEIVDAVLAHHAGEKATVLTVADYVAHQAGLGFVAAPEPPPEDALASYGCATVEAMDATVAELRSMLETELALLR